MAAENSAAFWLTLTRTIANITTTARRLANTEGARTTTASHLTFSAKYRI